MAQVVDGSVVGGEVGRFFAVFDKVVSEGEMNSGADACTFFADIGRIAGYVEDNVAGMIVECVIGVCFQVV